MSKLIKPATVKKVPAAKTRPMPAASQTIASLATNPAAEKPAPVKRKRAQRPLILDGKSLTRKAVIDVARNRRKVEISASALRRVARAATLLEAELRRGEPLYGVTTGFGSNADRILGVARQRASTNSGSEAMSLMEELQHKLIVSHAVCVGQPLDKTLTRAMLLLRLNTLLSGHSGIRTKPLKLMAALLNFDITPIVPELGSVGASGDLAPLSHLALPLIGVGDVIYRGQQVSALSALEAEDLEPVKLYLKEGLALNNGTTQMLASLVIALDTAEALLKQADINAALALEAFCGRSAAFDARVHKLRPHPGQMATADNIRRLIQGSGLVDISYHRVPRFQAWSPNAWSNSEGKQRTFDIRWDYVLPSERDGRTRFYQTHLPFKGGKKFQPQDAYCLRCTPQVHGAVKDVWQQVVDVVERELNAVTDNPLIFPKAKDDMELDTALPVLSAGNFHGMPLALAAANLKNALPVLASISERRLNKLLDPATNDGLPPFLIGNEDGTDSGLMIVQYTAAALVNELASRAHAACVYSIPTSANAEDHVSMGTNDTRHLLEMLANTERVLALELLCNAQALDYRMQVLDAAYALASNLGIQALRSKLRNISPARPHEAEELAGDLKRLQEDLRGLNEVRPSAVSQQLLALVRTRVSFLTEDRLLAPDLVAIQALVQERALLRLVEDQCDVSLDLS
jgi:histidine ammonia-lyase